MCVCSSVLLIWCVLKHYQLAKLNLLSYSLQVHYKTPLYYILCQMVHVTPYFFAV